MRAVESDVFSSNRSSKSREGGMGLREEEAVTFVWSAGGGGCEKESFGALEFGKSWMNRDGACPWSS